VTYRTTAPFRRRGAPLSNEVENFVDKTARECLPRLVSGAPDRPARKMGTKKAFKIKYMPSIVAAGRRQMPRNANTGAAVELSARAAGRSPDG
jgi:hypothetical protein